MLPRLLVTVFWFPFVGILLINNINLLKSYNTSQIDTKKETEADSLIKISAASPLVVSTGQVLAAHIIAGDGRQLLLEEFMRGTPLVKYSQNIVDSADHYGIDYRLVPAIAMCESNLGIRIPSSDSFNAWGIAVYTGQQEGATFADWPTAIDWVSNFIAEKFVSNGVIDIKEIGSIWAPPSVEKGHSWANCVEGFMRSIQ